VLDEAERRGTWILAVTTTPKAWRGNRKLLDGRKRIRLAVGLHPELVAERHSEVALLCALIDETRYVGEVGLDGSPAHRKSLPQQQRVFTRVLAHCENKGGRIVTIHSRGAAEEVLDSLEKHPRVGTPILHWFSGTTKQLARAVELGCWFSVGPAMTRSSKGRNLAGMMPLDRLLIETDAPFGTKNGRPLMPWEAVDCLPDLSAAFKIPEATLTQQIRANFRSLVSS
jgi:TatD DNase family protein